MNGVDSVFDFVCFMINWKFIFSRFYVLFFIFYIYIIVKVLMEYSEFEKY